MQQFEHNVPGAGGRHLALVGPAPTLYQRRIKRAIDVAVAGSALVVLSPLLGATALAVRVSLGRGVLFRQARVGHHGADFEMLKFRTMRHSRRLSQLHFHGPDRRTTHKTTDDPRHTRLGRFLRRSSLDELPQLLHVVRGEMSLVGPRPELSTIVERHGLRSHQRHTVRPGLTGEWQVTHRVNGTHLHECFDDDLPYVRDVTFRRDVSVLLRTLRVVANGS